MRLQCAPVMLVFLALGVSGVDAQGVRVPVPYNGQLRTDPDVGNVQGIQRYGRPLKTDPDQGEGYSYHVYPVAHDPASSDSRSQAAGPTSGAGRSFQSELLNPAALVARRGESGGQAQLKFLLEEEASAAKDLRDQSVAEAQQKWQRRIDDCIALLDQLQGGGPQALGLSLANSLRRDLDAEIEALTGERDAARSRGDEPRVEALNNRIEKCLNLIGAMSQGPAAAVPSPGATTYRGAGAPAQQPRLTAVGPLPGFSGPYPPAFDWTNGIRNYVVPLPPPGSPDDLVMQGIAVARAKGQTVSTLEEIYHQPLIQIKVRVVEVARGDGFAAGTILEYVANRDGVPTLTSGLTANTTGQNFRGISRLPLDDLATTAAAGTGTLFNLTTEHINGLVQLLATEANADVVTAPEVVTLNGQNVEFVSGEKVPFQLGQNVINGTNNNIQQFFYKHVGTMISVTPRIVNWGLHGEGQGEQPILAHDIVSFPRLVNWMAKENAPALPLPKRKFRLDPSNTMHAAAKNLVEIHQGLPDDAAIPFSAQGVLLKALNDFARGDVQHLKHDLIAERIIDDPCEKCRAWRGQDCTIDVTVVVRLSDTGTVTVTDGNLTNVATSESNIRAISNVIQLKSGHGVVMAGLIGNRDTEEVAKVPVLGDVPVVGFLFRNKTVARLKTEVLIFIEAQVLDPEPQVARMESSHDFLLGQSYVAGAFLDNPLEYGLYRVGFGSYLPPHSHQEKIFWERFGRKVRKIRTHLDDALE